MVVVDLVVKPEGTALPPGALVLTPSGKHEASTRRISVAAATSARFQLPADSAWEITPEFPGFWGPRKPLSVSAGRENQLTLELWAMGKVSGTLRSKEKGKPLPSTVLVKTLAAPAFAKRLPAPKGAMDCPVDVKGLWTCALSAAVFDLVVSAEGYVPFYHWGGEVPAGKEKSLGILDLAGC